MNYQPPPPPSDNEDGNMLPLVLVITISLFMVFVSLADAVSNQEEIPEEASEIVDPAGAEQLFNAETFSEHPWKWFLGGTVILASSFFVAGLVMLFAIFMRKALGYPILRSSWRFEPKWKLADVEYLTLFYLLVIFLGGPLLLEGGKAIDQLSRWAILAILQSSVMIAIYILVKHRQDDAAPALGLTSKNLGRNIWIGFAAFLSYLPVFAAIVIAQFYLFKRLGLRITPQAPVRIFTETDSMSAMVALVFMAVVLAPFLEELFFRSFLQGMLKKYCGSSAAIFGTALFFGAFHMNFYSLVPLFVIGIFLGYIYDRTQSYAAPVVLHMCWNGCTISLLVIHRIIGY